jgi:hypothetical protein
VSRLVQWLRFWRWQFASQQTLAARVLRAEQETVTVRADYEAELLAKDALHDDEMALLRQTVEELRRECRRWEEALADSERRRLVEVQRGNLAWQEAGVQRRRADGLQTELDRLAGEGVGHAAARD